ncbi:MAG TPA: cytochrome c [Candidatus Acidoferrales bacterium]|nr:cytochrome c [Candidatus Acidoferrales bacterium]
MTGMKAIKDWMRTPAVRWFVPLIAVLLILPAVRARADAEATYKAKCAGCHGPDGAGATAAGKAMKVRDFHSPEVQKETDAELTEIIANGKEKMPKYADKLKDAEIKELAGYVRTLGKK